MAVSPLEYRQAMGRFATGITVVTTLVGERFHGMTANAVTSVSLDPPTLLVVVGKGNDTHALIPKAGGFSLSILAHDQGWLSDRFAGRHGVEDPFEGVPWRPGRLGPPLIEGAVGHLECRLTDAFPAGDHTIYLGRVEALSWREDGQPLVYWRSRYASLFPLEDRDRSL